MGGGGGGGGGHSVLGLDTLTHSPLQDAGGSEDDVHRDLTQTSFHTLPLTTCAPNLQPSWW